MRLVDNTRYLALLRETLEATLVPELQSAAAKATAAVMQNLLDELLRREQQADAQFDALNQQAAVLAGRMRVFLERAGSTVPPAPAPVAHAEARLARHGEWLAELTRLCAAVSGVGQRAGSDVVRAEAARLLRESAEWELQPYLIPNQAPPERPRATEQKDKDGRLAREQVEAFVRRHHPDGDAVAVSDFEAIPGGYGKQTSRFTLRDRAGHARSLIVRKCDRHPMLQLGAFRIEHEFDLVRAVSATGFPAPKPLWLGVDEPGVDAGFYVMERLPGRVPGTFLGGAEGGTVPESLLLDLATQLARLHAIPLTTFEDVIRRHDDPALLAEGREGSVGACYRRAIESWRAYFDRLEHLPSPYFQYVIDWLLRNLPADDRRPVLVHGDFNIHNLLAEDGRLTGVLDWECAMFGAPEQDLAYIQPHVGRHIAWDRFMAAYHAAGGRAVDPASLPFYMAFSMMRLHVGMCRGLLNVQTGATRDLRYAVIELGFLGEFMKTGLASTR
ncbi:MAG TPA: phosphotransferase family protein [Nevskiaceae bacterium]|nr:phosphotransferase family protein [Nevskiaceae bacterium]